MNYTEALNFIESLINYEKKFFDYSEKNYDPKKIFLILKASDVNFSKAKIFHIAGTKGKGSTSIYLSLLIHNHTLKNTGLYTSPHVSKINERISINGKEISDEDFAILISEFEEKIKSERLTFFEALTFIAMVYFIRNKCEYIVLETGLGGRLDATNFCSPVLSIITPISFDHTKILGNTLSKIAYEKAGIIKELTPVISARQYPDALDVLKKVAYEKKAPFFYLPEISRFRIIKREKKGVVFHFSFKIFNQSIKLKNIFLTIPSDVFVENLLLATVSFYIHFKKLSEKLVKEVAMVKLPYRMKVENNYLLDVAHNDNSIKRLFESMNRYRIANKKKILLFIGLLEDKEIERIEKVVYRYRKMFYKIITFDFPAIRPTGSKRLFDLLNERKLKNLLFLFDLKDFDFKKNKDFFYLFTGSFYIVKSLEEILSLIEQ